MGSAFPWCFAARRSAQEMAVVLFKCCNEAAGHHASALRVGWSASMDCVAPLGKDCGHSRRGAP
ncbi:MAG: hypothetical protein AAEJ43_10050, partial [Gammaproteobacteria bacterium]